jgi:hypothetical protein
VRCSTLLVAPTALAVSMACGRETDDIAPSDAADADVQAADVAVESAADATLDAPDDSPATSTASLDFAPVCGSDGVTYWNDEQAAAMGVSATNGACSGASGRGPGACGPFSGTVCPAGTVCIGVYFSITPTYCTMTGDWNGQCWYIPPGARCPTTDARSYFDCTTSTCATYCELVRGVLSYRMDKSCP